MGKLYTIEDFMKEEFPPVQPLWGDNLISKDSVTLIYGYYNTFKSIMATNLAKSMRDGKPFLGIPTTKSSVLYLQTELPEYLFQDRASLMFSPNGTRPDKNLWLWNERILELDKTAGLEALDKTIAATRPDVLIIDPLFTVVSQDFSDFMGIKIVMKHLMILQEKYHLAIIIVHHSRKQNARDDNSEDYAADDAWGSVFLPGFVDTIIRLQRRNVDSIAVNVSFRKARRTDSRRLPRPFDVWFDPDTLSFYNPREWDFNFSE